MWTLVTISLLVGTGSYYIFQSVENVPSIASVSLHRLFDGSGWLLMPEVDIVKKFYESLKHSRHGGDPSADRLNYPDIRVRLLFIMT